MTWRSRPAAVTANRLLHGTHAAIDGQGVAGDVAGFVGQQPHDGISDCRLQLNRRLNHFRARFLQLNRRPIVIFAAKSWTVCKAGAAVIEMAAGDTTVGSTPN